MDDPKPEAESANPPSPQEKPPQVQHPILDIDVFINFMFGVLGTILLLLMLLTAFWLLSISVEPTHGPYIIFYFVATPYEYLVYPTAFLGSVWLHRCVSHNGYILYSILRSFALACICLSAIIIYVCIVHSIYNYNMPALHSRSIFDPFPRG